MRGKLVCSAAAIAACAGIFAPVARGSLVAYYSMNETSGSINDSSGNGVAMSPTSTTAFTYGVAGVPAGTYGAITVTPAESAALGTAISSSGSTSGGAPEFSSVSADTPIDSLTSSTGFTVMAWIDPSTMQAVADSNIHFFSSPGNPDHQWGFGIYAPGTSSDDYNNDNGAGNPGYGLFNFTTFGASDYKESTSGTQVPMGQWENVAVTYTTGKAVYFLNGVSVATVTGSDFTFNSADPYAIFGAAGSTTDYLTGAMQQVQIYSGVLTAAQIQAAAVTIVPEPASVGLAALGCVGLLLRRRRTTSAPRPL